MTVERERLAAKAAPDDDDTSDPDGGQAGDRKDDGKSDDKDDDDQPETPQQKYEARFPQSVRVSDIVGKPLVATDDSSLGIVTSVVRAGAALKLIVPFGGFLGFGRRAVAVPIEVVGSIGTAIVSLDMDRAAYVAAPTWNHDGETVLPADATVRIAIARH